jgi:hypothetical protein
MKDMNVNGGENTFYVNEGRSNVTYNGGMHTHYHYYGQQPAQGPEPVEERRFLEKKLEPNRPLPSPNKSSLADMVLEFCDQCEVCNGTTPGNACEAR